MQKRKLILVGAGGHGKDVLWRTQDVYAVVPTCDILGYCDDDPAKKGQMIFGYPVLGSPEEIDADLPEKPYFICSIGDNDMRAQVVQRVLLLGWTPISIIHPSVVVADNVVVGEGTFVGPQVTLGPDATIGNHVIINVGSTIGHDSVVGDFAQVSGGGRVSGACVLKERATLGSNAVVAPGKTVGRSATLGACSFAVKNIPDGTTVIGIPARVIFRRQLTKGQE